MAASISLKEQSYWVTPHPITTSYKNKTIPTQTDVLIIGSGYTGMTAALTLRKAGVHVTVLDQGQIGSEGSAKNGGMVLTGLSRGMSSVFKKYGAEMARDLFAESLASIDKVESLIQEGDIDCHFERCGHMYVAFKPSHCDYLKHEQEFLVKHLNHKTRLITRENLQEEIGSDFYHGGLVDPLSAGVHPAKYIAGLVRMADEAGVELHEDVKAEKIEKTYGNFKVKTSRGTIIADRVAVCTNGYTSGLTPWQQRRVVPMESYMIATEELPPDLIRKLIPNNRMIFDSKRLLYYFRLSPDRKRVLLGGRPEFYFKSPLEKAYNLQKGLYKVFPELAKYALEYAWYGKVGFTANFFPIIGRRNGIDYAMGFCGHGVAMATYFGCKLADSILGKGLNTRFGQVRSLPIPLYQGNPWFVPVILKIYKYIDKYQ